MQSNPLREAAPKRANGNVNCDLVECVALTYDDGPGEYTESLLDVLAAEGVPATFFVAGARVDDRPELVARMARDGHQVGNHSYSQLDLTTLERDGLDRDLQLATDAIVRAGAAAPTLVRAPMARVNDEVYAAFAEQGLTSVMWNVDSWDWQNRSVEETTRLVLDNITEGDIVLLHDVQPTTVQATPGIIAQLQERGYVLVTVGELSNDRVVVGESIYSRTYVAG